MSSAVEEIYGVRDLGYTDNYFLVCFTIYYDN